MNHDPNRSPAERELQELFDETAAVPSDAQLANMMARAEQIPHSHRKTKRSTAAMWIPIAAAAALALTIGGYWLGSRTESPPVASTAIDVPSVPTAVAVPEPAQTVDDPVIRDEAFDDASFLPADPLAVLDGEGDDGTVWVSELDLLHGPTDDEDDAYWLEMEALVEGG